MTATQTMFSIIKECRELELTVSFWAGLTGKPILAMSLDSVTGWVGSWVVAPAGAPILAEIEGGPGDARSKATTDKIAGDLIAEFEPVGSTQTDYGVLIAAARALIKAHNAAVMQQVGLSQ